MANVEYRIINRKGRSYQQLKTIPGDTESLRHLHENRSWGKWFDMTCIYSDQHRAGARIVVIKPGLQPVSWFLLGTCVHLQGSAITRYPGPDSLADRHLLSPSSGSGKSKTSMRADPVFPETSLPGLPTDTSLLGPHVVRRLFPFL